MLNRDRVLVLPEAGVSWVDGGGVGACDRTYCPAHAKMARTPLHYHILLKLEK